MPVTLCEFAEDLRKFLTIRSPEGMLKTWDQLRVDMRGRDALKLARRGIGGESVISEIDQLLLKVMSRVAEISGIKSPASFRLQTFRYAELERMQCAASAALVDRRYGLAGLHTLVEDEYSPLARRYFAFLCLSERHAPDDWGFFCKYLAGKHHHSFVATAIESLRYYPEREPSSLLLEIFEAVRNEPVLRRFLGPRILQTLYVLEDEVALPLFVDLLVAGHTEADPIVCEVMRAVAVVYRLTGTVPKNSKYRSEQATRQALALATSSYDDLRSAFLPVEVL
jgi:hypothetical protein